MMQGLVLHEDRAADVVGAARSLGLLVCPAGPDVVRFVPPLTITMAEIDEGVGLLERAVRTVEIDAASEAAPPGAAESPTAK